MSEIQKTIWSGSFWLGNVEIKCHVLEDGKRIIEAESINNLFAIEGSLEPTEDQIMSFAKWQKGTQ